MGPRHKQEPRAGRHVSPGPGPGVLLRSRLLSLHHGSPGPGEASLPGAWHRPESPAEPWPPATSSPDPRGLEASGPAGSPPRPRGPVLSAFQRGLQRCEPTARPAPTKPCGHHRQSLHPLGSDCLCWLEQGGTLSPLCPPGPFPPGPQLRSTPPISPADTLRLPGAGTPLPSGFKAFPGGAVSEGGGVRQIGGPLPERLAFP